MRQNEIVSFRPKLKSDTIRLVYYEIFETRSEIFILNFQIGLLL